MTDKHQPPIVLIIAGNDPSGGAGVTADTQAVSALGCHPAPVITALTVQDTLNAYRVEVASPDLVAEQIATVLDDLPVAAVKIGLLGNAEVGRAVADVLESHPELPIVLDPVLVAAGGARLAEEDLIETLKTQLIPMSTVVTPNASEARSLVPDADSLARRADGLIAMGAPWVLQKGADEKTPAVDNHLFGPDDFRQDFRWERLPDQYHGSGCTLASAIAAEIAHGHAPADAVSRAQEWTWQALKQGWRLGKGQYIPNRLSDTDDRGR
ncbi:hydroxymethylpyrimidine/phosphomethylpyrimidine kinase [Natronospira proteinivora]|uniref:hydroxymethylpyrimidine kinase n=1 Tax=Natronospira proteinivora TaxID=1807133 RepID=A0ABT1G409_9GAMM|nr:hydroxymethylpyrimidine/phosphomethylpyrimidine kinase [Natronospira proteinivora]MCP1726045.1 hydroxymethylpyrimidine/phosphomethylpyrimidine kinase [Natronospira proteinivora]